MKKIILSLTAIATLLSCSPDDSVITQETQEEVFVGLYSLTSVDFETSTGDATQFYEECPNSWDFRYGDLTRQHFDQETCKHMYQSENTYEFIGDTLFIGETPHTFDIEQGKLTIIRRVNENTSFTYNLETRY